MHVIYKKKNAYEMNTIGNTKVIIHDIYEKEMTLNEVNW